MTTLAQANTSLHTKGTTIASLTAMAVMIAVTAGVVSTLPASDPAWNAPTQFGRPTVAAVFAKSQPRSEERNEVGALEAIRVIPCMKLSNAAKEAMCQKPRFVATQQEGGEQFIQLCRRRGRAMLAEYRDGAPLRLVG